MKKLLFIINILLTQIVLSSPGAERSRPLPDRIQSLRFDRGVVKPIYLAPGLGAVVIFPCALVEVFTGRSEDLKVQISPNDKKTLFLNLKLNSSLPTNLIARCEAERNVFVFDVFPNRTRHQDVVLIRNSFGAPVNSDALTAQNQKPTTKVVLKTPELIGKGGK